MESHCPWDIGWPAAALRGWSLAAKSGNNKPFSPFRPAPPSPQPDRNVWQVQGAWQRRHADVASLQRIDLAAPAAYL